jgi:serine/threonine protein kinase
MAGLEDRRSNHRGRPQWRPGGLADTERVGDEPPDPWLGLELEGRFEIVDRIGQGGVATVYRARERGLISRDVAIKLLTLASSSSAETVARFRNEAQIIADIHHPHVVHIHHAARAPNGQFYIVMELLRGQNLLDTLHDLAADGEAIPWRRLAPMMLQVCAALQAAHAHGIIHRDIKPNNCFRVDLAGDPDFIKVLDFGVAKTAAHIDAADSRHGPLTLPDNFIGTPHYAAPEIIDPNLGWPVDGRVDVFAVGVMMYQCLTGGLPFAGCSDRAALHKTLREPPPRLRERAPDRAIAPAVEDLVLRAMATRPDDRFPDINGLAAAIRAASAERTVITVGSIVDPEPADDASTVRRTLPPRETVTRLVERDALASTPRSSSVITSTDPITEPAPPPLPPPPRDARGVLVTVVLMVLGVIVMLLLLRQEVVKKRTTKTIVPTSEPEPLLDDGETTGASEPAASPDTTTTIPREEATPRPIVTVTPSPATELPDSVDRRRRKIADIAQDLASPLRLLDCKIDMTQRWRLPLVLTVSPTGQLIEITPTRQADELRLEPAEQTCLLRVLKNFTFPRGGASLTVRTTIRGGPP